MRRTTLAFCIASGLAIATPGLAQSEFDKIIGGVAQSLLGQERDRTAYIEAQRLNTPRAYRDYLARFPNGAFRGNAQQALARLGVPVDRGDTPPVINTGSAASVEASLGLTRADRIRIQKQLTLIGYPTGVADGLWGSVTRRAIVRWQTAAKVPATGYLTARQVRLIAQQAGPVAETPSEGTITGDDVIEERLLSLTYAERREVQQRLSILGYSIGVDGSFGPNTRRALASWQRDEGLRATGYLTADQLSALRRDTGG